MAAEDDPGAFIQAYRLNRQKPYDPAKRRGDKDDSAWYLVSPDDYFTRPWVAVPGTNMAFIWPLGVEGFSLAIDPTLGIHKYLGDNDVEVDVTHWGEEHVTLSGLFPGLTAVNHMQSLRNVVYRRTGRKGKALFLPGILESVQYVQVVNARFEHPETPLGGEDLSYSIEFVRQGKGPQLEEPDSRDTVPNTGASGKNRGRGIKKFTVTSKYNTLRKIAARVYHNANRWGELYDENDNWFKKRNIAKHRAPNHRLPLGTVIYY